MKRIPHLILLLILIFSSCGKSNKKNDSENLTIEKSEAQLEIDKPNAEKLF
jgi:ABC-type Fe3+-citrate transport system substrate-binding protein